MPGSHQQVAFVDLTTESVRTLEIPRALRQRALGGRGLGVALLAMHGPSREPLEDDALLCMMVGPLTGSDFPLANRLALVFRSPLTRTVAWAMTGGYIATEMRKGGLDGIVVSGRAKRPCYLLIRGLTDHRPACVGPVGTWSGRDRVHDCRLRTRTRTCWRSARPASAFRRSRPSSTTRAGQAVYGMGLAVYLEASVSRASSCSGPAHRR